jgi:hypothetical protein
VGRVVRPSWAAGSKEQKNEYLNKKDFLHSTNFKLLRKIQGNSINNCNYFNACNFCQGRPLFVLVPGVKNLAAPLDTFNWQLSDFKENNTDLAQQT